MAALSSPLQSLQINGITNGFTHLPDHNGYERLTCSLSTIEKSYLNLDMSKYSDDDIKKFQATLNEGRLVCTDIARTRETIVTALKALKQGLITLEQMASIHIFDAAVRDFLSHRTVFLVYEYFNAETKSMTEITDWDPKKVCTVPTTVVQKIYYYVHVPNNTNLDELPARARRPVLQQFFAMDEREWQQFDQIMKTKTLSEQIFCRIIYPRYGCCSGLINRIQETIKLCHPVKIWHRTDNSGLKYEMQIVIPSFSMLQAVIDVKATTLGRKSVTLTPVYHPIKSDEYAHLKKQDMIPFGLYFPESSPQLKYNIRNPKFKGSIDGWAHEGPFALLLQDFYHALRALIMNEKVTAAVYRLAELAKSHPLDQQDNKQSTSERLIDGELINTYPVDTIFEPDNICHSQKFGTILGMLHLPAELRSFFIQDMVDNKDLWRAEFDLGRDDLLPEDQQTYDKKCI